MTSSADKRGLVRMLGTIIAAALGLPKATGPDLMSPEVAAEYVVRCMRMIHSGWSGLAWSGLIASGRGSSCLGHIWTLFPQECRVRARML